MGKNNEWMKVSLVFLMIILFAIFSKNSDAVPPFSTEFYGNVTMYNQPTPVGTNIRVEDANGSVCGSFTVRTAGYYGFMSCLSDDPTTTDKEGPETNDGLFFFVDGLETTSFGNDFSTPGSFYAVDLVVPVIRCGDNFCDSRESCSTCELDCGLCIPNLGEGNKTGTGNGSGNGQGGGGGGGGSDSGSGGGGGSGSGSGSGGAGGDSTVGDYLQGIVSGDIFGVVGDVNYFACVEKWVCGNWTICPPTEIQTRSCEDINNCGTFDSKPIEKKACIYGEERIKQEIKEEETKKPRREIPLEISFPKIVCTKEVNPLKNGAIWFFLVILLIIATRIYSMEKSIDKISKKKGIDDFKRAKLLFATKRKTYLFIGLMVFFAIVLYIFYVFFFLCEVNFTALWLLIIFVILLPIITHQVIEFFEYHEQEKLLRMEALADTHYKQIKRLLEIESANIVEIEKEIGGEFEFLRKSESFQQILDSFPELEKIYDELIELYTDYEKKKSLIGEEVKLVDDIYEIANKDEFVELSEKSPDIKLLYDKLLLLYRHYEEKQGLYEELARAEDDLRKRLRERNPKSKIFDDNNYSAQEEESDNKSNEDNKDNKSNNNI